MSVPTSIPQEKPQPNRQTYGEFDLALFRCYSREEYKQAFGVDAPPFDPTRPPKYWFDTSVGGPDVDPEEEIPSPYRYVRVFNDAAKMSTLTMTVAEASTVNIPEKGQSSSKQPRPIPLRPLKDNEGLKTVPFGGWIVVRTDLTPGGTLSDRQLLVECHDMLKALLSK